MHVFPAYVFQECWRLPHTDHKATPVPCEVIHKQSSLDTWASGEQRLSNPWTRQLSPFHSFSHLLLSLLKGINEWKLYQLRDICVSFLLVLLKSKAQVFVWLCMTLRCHDSLMQHSYKYYVPLDWWICST